MGRVGWWMGGGGQTLWGGRDVVRRWAAAAKSPEEAVGSGVLVSLTSGGEN